MTAKKRAPAPKKQGGVGELTPAVPAPPVRSQASRHADEARRQRQPRADGRETPLMYARRIAGWPRLKEDS